METFQLYNLKQILKNKRKLKMLSLAKRKTNFEMSPHSLDLLTNMCHGKLPVSLWLTLLADIHS